MLPQRFRVPGRPSFLFQERSLLWKWELGSQLVQGVLQLIQLLLDRPLTLCDGFARLEQLAEFRFVGLRANHSLPRLVQPVGKAEKAFSEDRSLRTIVA